MPYKIEKIDENGYKVCKKDDSKCFSNEPLSLEQAEKQLKAIGMNTHLKGMGKNKIFKNQLEEIDLTPENYLNLVKIVAEHRKYNPDLLKIADDGIHKLEYNNVKFGRVGYNDLIIYTWLEYNKMIPAGTAKLKKINYRKRAREIMRKTKNKYSPASLSYQILW